MPIKDYRDLDIWKKGIDIVDTVYDFTDGFPKEELYSLTSQLRRAAISIPSNIAEGFARHHKREYTQFLYVALGSCAELMTQLIIAKRRNYISDEQLMKLSETVDHESRMVMSLIKKL